MNEEWDSEEWDSMEEDEDWKEWWEHAIEDEEADQNELKTAREKLLKGKGKLQYHTKKDLPTKEEIMEKFRLGRIDQAYEKKW